jgi:DNA processing protein
MNKVNTLTLKSSNYPDSLKNIPSAPDQLYIQGEPLTAWFNQPKVAIVGSRKVTTYGRTTTDRFASELAKTGIVIISGLALGVDYIAHSAALKVGGVTVAVLPTSLKKIYPAGHANLAHQIVSSGGSLITEYSPNDPIYKVNFTARNRIVAGLADIVLITEAAVRSGTLTTARYALEQGKTVMAVPGNITSPSSEGTNNLIKSGALPATSVDDVFFALGYSAPKKSRLVFRGTPEEEAIIKLLGSGVCDQEELAIKSGIDIPIVVTTLTSLEIAGQIKAIGGGQWILS